ncbi:MAG: hypothetical protein WC614_01515 [bacterium]
MENIHDYILDYKELEELGLEVEFCKNGTRHIMGELINFLEEYDGNEVIVCKKNSARENNITQPSSPIVPGGAFYLSGGTETY